MLARFSVKKPFTVLVAVLLVIILGVVAFTRMTPDLLPSLEFPYAVVVTTYMGASPEQVESEVTQPVEQALATLSGVKTVDSSSAESYSMVMLSFEEGTDMDAAAFNIREKLRLLEGGWSDYVGTPNIIKIDPNMLPVTVAATSFEGMDKASLSDFIEQQVLPALEGADGVASVSSSGLLEQSISVVISDQLLQQANGRISESIIESFGELEGELQSGIGSAQSGMAALEEGRDQITGAQVQLARQIDSARLQLTGSREQLLELKENRPEIEAALTAAKGQYAALDGQLAALREQLRAQNPGYASLSDGELDAILASGDSSDPLSAAYGQIMSGYAAIDSSLAAFSVSREGIDAMLQTLGQLEEKISAVDSALSELEVQYATASAGIYDKLVDLASGKAALASTVQQLESALSELSGQRDAAIESADLTGILTRDTVSAILTAQNLSMPAGYIEDGEDRSLLRVQGSIDGIEQLQQLVLLDLGLEGVEPVRLSEVAEVSPADNSGESWAVLDGSDGVLFSFQKQSGVATATVCENISDTFRELEQQYPGLKFVSLMDQGDYIRLTVDSVLSNLGLGAALAAVILLLFLMDIRPTLVTALSIPISVTFAVVLMYFSGVSLNIISLSGLAVGVGMLVDNSIVVTENIYRLRALGESPIKAAVSGAVQVTGAITGSTLTTVCVFFPLVFVQGITRQLFTDMALTIAYSLLASLVVALTLVPATASSLFKKQPRSGGRGEQRFRRGYSRVLGAALGHKALTLLLTLGLLAASLLLAVSRGFTFMPEMSSPQISVSVTMPEGSSLQQTDQVCSEAVQRIMQLDGVESVGAMLSQGVGSVVGLGSLGGSADPEKVSMYVMLEDSAAASSKHLCREIESVCADLPFEISADDGSSMTSATAALGGSGITVEVYCDDLDQLQSTAKLVAGALSKVQGVASVQDGIGDTVQELRVVVDQNAAMEKGITVAEIYSYLAGELAGEVSSTSILDNGVEKTITVAGDSALPAGKLENLAIPLSGGGEVLLTDVAAVERGEALGSISRSGQRRYLSVTAATTGEENLTIVAARAQQALEQLPLPEGARLSFSGENESIMQSLGDLMSMLALGVVMVYLVMVAQFQSLLSPFIVLFTIPLAFTGGLLALLLAGMEISVVSMIGFVLLVGVIVNTGSVLVDCINMRRREGMDRRQAIEEACAMRIRPVLMTALTTILGLLPAMLGIGTGAELMQPVAVVCIGGLTYATLMTLVILPVIYDLLAKRPPRVVSAADLELSDR